MKLIAETAWHHEGDYLFMKDLVSEICESSTADVVKLHITLDLDEYMSRDHDAYDLLKKWLFTPEQWEDLISIIQASGKEIILLLNDTRAVGFASQYNPDMIEIHSVCLNVPRLHKSILKKINNTTKVVIGVGGCTLQEVDEAIRVFNDWETILMFGFQNYPTKYEDVNLSKIRKIQSFYSNKMYGYADHTAWNEENNELITLLVSANGMDYIEKHVTIEYGKERCDYSAAISIEKFNMLGKKLNIVNKINGNSSMLLNMAEQDYCRYGPMKMAALAKYDLNKGSVLTLEGVHFSRTSQSTSMSQIDLLQVLGRKLAADVKKNQVIDWNHLDER